MNDSRHLEYLKQRTDFGQARLVGRISLWFSFLAIIGLLIVLLTVASPGDSYLQNIRSLSIAQNSLPWVMLFAVHSLWSQQIRSVVQVFRHTLHRIRSRQFSAPEHIDKPAHELLSLLNHWYANEQQRIAALKREIEQLDIKDQYQQSDLQVLKEKTNRCLGLLEGS